MNSCGRAIKLITFKLLADLLNNTDSNIGPVDAFSDLKVRDAMRGMWVDAGVQKAIACGHKFARHDNLV
jgi:guanine nucleotide-binding protein subunit alpha, other